MYTMTRAEYGYRAGDLPPEELICNTESMQDMGAEKYTAFLRLPASAMDVDCYDGGRVNHNIVPSLRPDFTLTGE
jgi:hypothetical protein